MISQIILDHFSYCYKILEIALEKISLKIVKVLEITLTNKFKLYFLALNELAINRKVGRLSPDYKNTIEIKSPDPFFCFPRCTHFWVLGT